jgi:hypothetical protein
MLKKLDYDYVIANRPCVIEVDGGVSIRIDVDNNVIVRGQSKLMLEVNGDLELDAKNITMHASESFNLDVDGDIHIGSSTHLVQQAPRIDLNPKVLSTGYRGKK